MSPDASCDGHGVGHADSRRNKSLVSMALEANGDGHGASDHSDSRRHKSLLVPMPMGLSPSDMESREQEVLRSVDRAMKEDNNKTVCISQKVQQAMEDDQGGTSIRMKTLLRSGSVSDPETLRGRMYVVMGTRKFDSVAGIVIILNICLMVVETNARASCHGGDKLACTETSWIDAFNLVFLILYSFEAAARCFVWRCAVFRSRWNLLDFMIVVVGWIDQIVNWAVGDVAGLENVAILRIFRMLRLLRFARMLAAFPELHQMLRGFCGAMMAMFWGIFMILILFLIWAIVAVEAINGISRTRLEDALGGDEQWCRQAFGSIQTCMLLLFQTIFAGDSWGYCSVPLIQESPVLIVIFGGALISISLGFTNLVLAVIVENANKATANDREISIRLKKVARRRATEILERILRDIDSSGDGVINICEAVEGYETNPELSDLLTEFDITGKDWGKMFNLLCDENGDVSIEECVGFLEGCDHDGVQRQLLITASYLSAIHFNCKELLTGMRYLCPEERCEKTLATMRACALSPQSQAALHRRGTPSLISTSRTSKELEAPSSKGASKAAAGEAPAWLVTKVAPSQRALPPSGAPAPEPKFRATGCEAAIQELMKEMQALVEGTFADLQAGAAQTKSDKGPKDGGDPALAVQGPAKRESGEENVEDPEGTAIPHTLSEGKKKRKSKKVSAADTEPQDEAHKDPGKPHKQHSNGDGKHKHAKKAATAAESVGEGPGLQEPPHKEDNGA